MMRFRVANRTICGVLDEMRQCNKTHNYAYLESLIEEAQSMANRMEAALWNQKDYKYAREEHKELKAKLKKLRKEVDNDSSK